MSTSPIVVAPAQARLITIRSASPSSRLILRSPQLSDVRSLTARGNDPLCVKYLPYLLNPRNPITDASNEKQVKGWRADSGIKGFFLVVVLRSEHDAAQSTGDTLDGVDATIGDTGIIPFDLAAKTGECGIMLNSGPTVRGRGYAVEALDMNFAYGFDHLGLESIKFDTHKDNEPMRNLLKKFGLPEQWREAEDDWSFNATREWWNARQREAGELRVVVEVEETILGEEEK